MLFTFGWNVVTDHVDSHHVLDLVRSIKTSNMWQTQPLWLYPKVLCSHDIGGSKTSMNRRKTQDIGGW
jgi:hypothetical protein